MKVMNLNRVRTPSRRIGSADECAFSSTHLVERTIHGLLKQNIEIQGEEPGLISALSHETSHGKVKCRRKWPGARIEGQMQQVVPVSRLDHTPRRLNCQHDVLPAKKRARDPRIRDDPASIQDLYG